MSVWPQAATCVPSGGMRLRGRRSDGGGVVGVNVKLHFAQGRVSGRTGGPKLGKDVDLRWVRGTNT